MKYAFFISLLLLSNVVLSNDNHIKSFNDSIALTTISQFLEDASEDADISTRISDKKLKIKDPSICVDATSADALKDAQFAIRGVLRLYPDEDLPIEEALVDLKSYLSNVYLKKCIYMNVQSHKKVQSIYYFNAAGDIHLKLDIVTLSKI